MSFDGEKAKLEQAARVLNPYGKRTSKPEPGQTWRVRVPRSAHSEAYVERDGVVLAQELPLFPRQWFLVEVEGRRRYVKWTNMLHMVEGRATRADCCEEHVTEHDPACHYRIAATHGAVVACPHGCGGALDCEHCYPCTCKTPQEAAE